MWLFVKIKERCLFNNHKKIYVINALDSRGFMFGPYLAKILSENILNNKEIPKELFCEKLFYKFARAKD